MRYAERIVYGGFKCDRVQRDSFAYPANEIAVLVTVSELNTGNTVRKAFPSFGGHYKNIRNGSMRFTSQTVWEGPAQSVDVHVVMIEVDGDGGALRNLTNAAFTAVQVAYSRGGSRPGPAVSGTGSSNPAADLVAKGLGKVFGTGDDLVGHARMEVRDDEGSGYWWENPANSYVRIDDKRRKRASVRYHFTTRHRRGGADCTVYFLFQRGRELGYETAGPPPPSAPPRERRFVPTSGVDDLGGTEYRCEIDGRTFHLKDSSAIYYHPNGSYSRPGRTWGARDRLCHFEIDFYGDFRGTFCVGDMGKVTSGNADGPQRGRCWVCEGAECRP